MLSSLTSLPIFCCWHLFLSLAALVSSWAAPLCLVRHPTTSTNEPISTDPTGRPTHCSPGTQHAHCGDLWPHFPKTTALVLSEQPFPKLAELYQCPLAFQHGARSHPKRKREPISFKVTVQFCWFLSKQILSFAGCRSTRLLVENDAWLWCLSFNLCPVCIFPSSLPQGPGLYTNRY